MRSAATATLPQAEERSAFWTRRMTARRYKLYRTARSGQPGTDAPRSWNTPRRASLKLLRAGKQARMSPLWQALLAADAAAASAAAAAGCSPRALKACVGTALALVAVHHLLTSRRGAAEAAPVGAPDNGPALAAPQATRAVPPATAAAARLPARVCVATPGVIFAGPADALAEGQALALAEHAASAIATLAAVTDVYLITQVAPGDGAVRAEAAARESLLAAGVVGSGAGAVPPHRALFCTTQVGRIALVRQVRTLQCALLARV